MLDEILEYLANKVKTQESKVINDIPYGKLDEFKKKSRQMARETEETYNFFRLGLRS